MADNTFIYGLKDPITNVIRYIGKSNNPEQRYKQHLVCKHNEHKMRWINKLKSKGYLPILVIIEEIPVSEWEEREKYWIKVGNIEGWKLTNIQLGGVDTSGKYGNIDYEKHQSITELNIFEQMMLPVLSSEDFSRLRELSSEQQSQLIKQIAQSEEAKDIFDNIVYIMDEVINKTFESKIAIFMRLLNGKTTA